MHPGSSIDARHTKPNLRINEVLGRFREDPSTQRYLARVALAPAMHENFYLLRQVDICDEVSSTQPPPLLEISPSNNCYAWMRMPLWLHHREQARKATEASGQFTIVDLCSSYGIYAELQRSKNFTRVYRYAQGLVNKVINEPLDNLHITEIDHVALREAKRQIMKSRNMREILISHVRRVLYGFDENEVPPVTEPYEAADLLTNRLMYEIFAGREVYVTTYDDKHTDGRYKVDTVVCWLDQPLIHLLAESQTPTDTAKQARKIHDNRKHEDEISAVRSKQLKLFQLDKEQERLLSAMQATEPVGKQKAANGLYAIALRIAQLATEQGLIRSYRAISVDREDPLNLFESGRNSFDPETLASGIYHRAGWRMLMRNDHVQADITEVTFWEPIPDSSVSLMTSIEGFPYHFEDLAREPDGQKKARMMARNIFRKLQLGGHFIAFPWTVPTTARDMHRCLDSMVEVWLDNGADITIKPYRANELIAAAYSKHTGQVEAISPLFASLDPEEILNLLVVVKDKGRQRLHKKLSELAL